ELKAHPAFLDLLGEPAAVDTLVSVYFDTDQFDLREHGLTLRVRRQGDQFIQTIKTLPDASTGLLERDQWEQPILSDQPDLSAAAGSALDHVLSSGNAIALKPIFETRIQRTTYNFARNGEQIELSFDEGQVVAGEQSSQVCEIELELKQGRR